MRSSGGQAAKYLGVGGFAAFLVLCVGCHTSARIFSGPELDEAVGLLGRPTSGDLRALYRLRVPSSGGLRLAVAMAGDRGRMTVSEPFGSAVSVTVWDGASPPSYFDLREGCRIEAIDLAQVLGVGALPFPEAVRLLAGRLPSVATDRVIERADGRLLIAGEGWSALVELAADPWRVVKVVQGNGHIGAGWTVLLADHSSSVPGMLHLKRADGRWSELRLIRLEWADGGDLGDLPDLPVCVEVSNR